MIRELILLKYKENRFPLVLCMNCSYPTSGLSAQRWDIWSERKVLSSYGWLSLKLLWKIYAVFLSLWFSTVFCDLLQSWFTFSSSSWWEPWFCKARWCWSEGNLLPVCKIMQVAAWSGLAREKQSAKYWQLHEVDGIKTLLSLILSSVRNLTYYF